MNIVELEPAARLKALVASDPGAIDGYLATLSGADVVRAMFRLESEERHAILRVVEPETAAEFIEDVPDEVAADLIEALPADDAASIVTALPSHERADVLAEVEDEDMDRILGAMAPESAREARELLSYPSESAGGLMVRQYLAFPVAATARTVLEELTSGVRDLSRYLLQYAYAVEADGTLVGVVRTRDLVAAAPDAPIGSLMGRPTAVNAQADLATVDACLEESEVLSLPVTDDSGRMLGVVRTGARG